MSRYRVGLFYLDNGGLKNADGTTMEQWLDDMEHHGYRLVGPCQPVANETGVYVVATAELDENHDEYNYRYQHYKELDQDDDNVAGTPDP